MTPVEQLESQIQRLRNQGLHEQADSLQSQLDVHIENASSAEETFLASQRERLRARGFI
jgi:hypothetical protein